MASAALPLLLASILTGLPLSTAVAGFAPGGWPPVAVSNPRTVVVP